MKQAWYSRAIRALSAIKELEDGRAARVLMAGIEEGIQSSVFQSGKVLSVRYGLMLMDLEEIDAGSREEFILAFLSNALLHTADEQIRQELQRCIEEYQARERKEEAQ